MLPQISSFPLIEFCYFNAIENETPGVTPSSNKSSEEHSGTLRGGDFVATIIRSGGAYAFKALHARGVDHQLSVSHSESDLARQLF